PPASRGLPSLWLSPPLQLVEFAKLEYWALRVHCDSWADLL
ncbi:hypothetical protein MPH_13831, partial [Macrophomina phaseolina MS6]